MSITATVHQGTVTPPPKLNLPDGTEVEIVVDGTPGQKGAAQPTTSR